MMSLTIDTPVGPLTLTERDDAIVRLAWGRAEVPSQSPLLDEAAQQLEQYFAGQRRTFELPLAPAETAFQRRVFAAMCEIPFGETRSHGEIAQALGSVARAVGGACGSNPIPIIVPCHRVLGAAGALGGFSGGRGRETKTLLLRHEGALPAELPLGLP